MNRLDPSNIRQPFGRVYPFADRPATPTHQVFPAFRPADAPNARRPATAPGRVITQLRGRGTVVATRPHTRRGLRQKDGFDLDLTRSSVEQFTQLSSFRASVVSRIRRANGRSLDATTGPAADRPPAATQNETSFSLDNSPRQCIHVFICHIPDKIMLNKLTTP